MFRHGIAASAFLFAAASSLPAYAGGLDHKNLITVSNRYGQKMVLSAAGNLLPVPISASNGLTRLYRRSSFYWIETEDGQVEDVTSFGSLLWQDPIASESQAGKRSYPAIAQAWNGVQNLPKQDPISRMAKHDLIFAGMQFFKLRWEHEFSGVGTKLTPQSIEKGLTMRRNLLEKNANIKLLAELRFFDAKSDHFPRHSFWWKRDESGNPQKSGGMSDAWLIAYSCRSFQDRLIDQAEALLASGVVDGFMFDFWKDEDAQVKLLTKLRQRVGDKPLILLNTNDEVVPKSTPYVNGCYMEAYRSQTRADWNKIISTLDYAEKHVREPKINVLETWYDSGPPAQQLQKMRATTTLAMTRSSGYALFCSPQGHFHLWYPFWDMKIGEPMSAGLLRKDGSYIREFKKGTALFNPIDNTRVKITFNEPRKRASDGVLGKTFVVSSHDGDLFLRD